MAEVTAKLKSRGFASYIPPGRRAVSTELQAKNIEKDHVEEMRNCKTEGEITETMNIIDATANTAVIIQEIASSDELRTQRPAKKISAGGPREYVPPSRRGIVVERTERKRDTVETKKPEGKGECPSEGKRVSMSELMQSATISDISSDGVDQMTVRESSIVDRQSPVRHRTEDNPSDLSRPEEEKEGNMTKKAKKLFGDVPRGNYIPPARRAMIAEEQRLDAEAEAAGVKRVTVPKALPIAPNVHNLPIVAIATGAKKCEGYVMPPPVPQIYYEDAQEDVRRCSYVVRGLPPELPEVSKDRYLKTFVDKAGVVRWISPNEALLVFASEVIGKTAVSTHKNSLLHLVPLHTLDEHDVEVYLPVSTDLFSTFNPQRDCRVANRMISAALGIALPKRIPMPVRAKSPKKIDAWDD